MKKIGVITIFDNNNYGNRLQNYAVCTTLNKLGYKSTTIINDVSINNKGLNKLEVVKRKLKIYYRKLKNIAKIVVKNNQRYKLFLKFNKNINLSNKYFSFLDLNGIKEYDYFVVGSDQVWNPFFERLSDFDLLNFTTSAKKIAFAASFGIDILPEKYITKVAGELKKFDAISVREEKGKKIIKELTGREDVEVLVDPTMLLTADEWDKVAKRPKQMDSNKYILNYFLGELSEQRKEEINAIAKENGCEVINIMDKNNPFYQTGPSEFLYLEKNAFLICTDSFHSCVFAIIYNRPFIVFDREDKNVNMNSRIETLIDKFNLKNRKFMGRITNENLQWDYTEAYEILENERKKSNDFLKYALNFEEE